MKRILGVLGAVALFWGTAHAELSEKKIETIVQQIQGKRTSHRVIDFVKVPAPFAVVVPKDENHTAKIVAPKEVVDFSLGAVVNDKAYINGRWVRKGETILGYTVESIGDGEVVLKKDDRMVHLFLPEQRENKLLQITEG